METKIIRVEEGNKEGEWLAEAGEMIKRGGLVAFPTETVYGLGGDALQEESARKIYQAKGRPSDNPLIVHICCWEDIDTIVREVPEAARKLAKAFWPGPLTMVLHKSERVPYTTTGGLDTVAVRMPAHWIALALIRAAGGYVAAPSANRSGRPSPTLAEYVKEDMEGRIDMILEGDWGEIGLESTIVDLTGEIPIILRPGCITRQMLEQVVGQVEVDETILKGTASQIPLAPGMKYRHYAPKGDMVIYEGPQDAVVAAINREIEKHLAQGAVVGVLATDETKMQYVGGHVRSIGSRKDEDSIAAHLYKTLRDFPYPHSSRTARRDIPARRRSPEE